MRVWLPLFGIAVMLSSGGSMCVERNPAYCDQSTPCTDPNRPFCEGNRCNPIPGDGGGTCDTSPECPEATPICDPNQMFCRSCAGNDECTMRNADTPICDTNGQCVSACESSADCPASLPICGTSDLCVLCEPGATGDTDCANRDAQTSRCASDGTCVQCLESTDCTSPTAPICNTVTSECRPCELHTECASEVCDLDSGACEDPGDIVYVDGDDGTDGGACGSQLAPCATIVGASGGLDKVGGSRLTLFVRPSAAAYTGTVDLDSIELTIIGPGATIDPVASGIPGLRADNGATVTIDGLRITGGNGGANGNGVVLRDTGTSLRLRRVTIDDNSGQGINAADGTLVLERSAVNDNLGGGISITGSAFTLRNNFIIHNGQVGAGGTTFGGVSINNATALSPQIFEFNTVADSLAQTAAPAAGVNCLTSTAMTATNNIVYLRTGGTAMVAGTCTWTYSDIENGPAGTGNINADPQFADDVGGDFHIKASSPCRNTADPDATLGIDFDGDDRPQGARHDMGADEAPP